MKLEGMFPQGKLAAWAINIVSSLEPKDAHRAADVEELGVLQAKAVAVSAFVSTVVTAAQHKGGRY